MSTVHKSAITASINMPVLMSWKIIFFFGSPANYTQTALRNYKVTKFTVVTLGLRLWTIYFKLRSVRIDDASQTEIESKRRGWKCCRDKLGESIINPSNFIT